LFHFTGFINIHAAPPLTDGGGNMFSSCPASVRECVCVSTLSAEWMEMFQWNSLQLINSKYRWSDDCDDIEEVIDSKVKVSEW